MITERELQEATGEPVSTSFSVEGIDMAGANPGRPILAFLDEEKYIEEARQNPSLHALLVTPGLAEAARTIGAKLIVVDDPRWYFYSLHNYLAVREGNGAPSSIADDASIHPTAYVDPYGVVIRSLATVEANATILSSSSIGVGAIIRAGAVVGTSGFEHKRTSRGVLSVVHDGETRIGDRAEVGSLAVIGRGFARRHTIVGNDTKIDCQAMIAHGSQLGERVFVAAGAVLAGSTTIGNDTWIGPSATLVDRVVIGEDVRVGIGSVVFRDIPDGARVLGNPARVTSSSAN